MSRHPQPLSSCRTHSARFQQPFSSSQSVIEELHIYPCQYEYNITPVNVSNKTYSALQRGSSPCHRMSRCTQNAGRFQFSSPSSSATRHNAFHIYQRSPPSWCAWPVKISTHKNQNEYSFVKIYLLYSTETELQVNTGALENCTHSSFISPVFM